MSFAGAPAWRGSGRCGPAPARPLRCPVGPARGFARLHPGADGPRPRRAADGSRSARGRGDGARGLRAGRGLLDRLRGWAAPTTRRARARRRARAARPFVLDADGLYAFAGTGRRARRPRRRGTVLTPHAGELARLVGARQHGDRGHRLQHPRAAAQMAGLRRGAQGRRHADRRAGGAGRDQPGRPPALATAGTGDVLRRARRSAARAGRRSVPQPRARAVAAHPGRPPRGGGARGRRRGSWRATWPSAAAGAQMLPRGRGGQEAERERGGGGLRSGASIARREPRRRSSATAACCSGAPEGRSEALRGRQGRRLRARAVPARARSAGRRRKPSGGSRRDGGDEQRAAGGRTTPETRDGRVDGGRTCADSLAADPTSSCGAIEGLREVEAPGGGERAREARHGDGAARCARGGQAGAHEEAAQARGGTWSSRGDDPLRDLGRPATTTASWTPSWRRFMTGHRAAQGAAPGADPARRQ